MCGATPKVSQARMAILSEASTPSRSRLGSASANPSCCASRMASAGEAPRMTRSSTKFDVPLSTPRIRVTPTPAAPERSARTTGRQPPTAPSKSSWPPKRAASEARLAPSAATSALFAVTTRRPCTSAAATIVRAGSRPPMVSTTTSHDTDRNAASESVTTPGRSAILRALRGSRTSTFTISTRRRPMWGTAINCAASAPPTVPHPASATRSTLAGGASLTGRASRSAPEDGTRSVLMRRAPRPVRRRARPRAHRARCARCARPAAVRAGRRRARAWTRCGAHARRRVRSTT